MAPALSQDLWDRVVGAIEGGLSCRAVARFGVGAAMAMRWRQLALRHGRAVAKAIRRWPRSSRAWPNAAVGGHRHALAVCHTRG